MWKASHSAVPATDFVDNLRFLRAVETIFVRKERLNSASVLKNNLEQLYRLQQLLRFFRALQTPRVHPYYCKTIALAAIKSFV